MGKSKEEFIDVRMQMDFYKSLEEQQRNQMEVKLVDELGWKEAYKKDLAWLELKKESRKAYASLKKREFEIRNR